MYQNEILKKVKFVKNVLPKVISRKGNFVLGRPTPTRFRVKRVRSGFWCLRATYLGLNE